MNPGAWWQEITRRQWYVLGAAQAGWALDAFDVMLYSFALTVIMQEWSLSPATAGFMVTLMLLASSIGGIIFGVVADQIGRRKALIITILIFSIASGLSSLAQNVIQLAMARGLLGLGMGGEWASGALLVSESWPAAHRGKAIGLMQSGWAIGYILAALASAVVLPTCGWRVLFLLGILPAFFTLWIRTRVEEPALWTKARGLHQRKRDGGWFGFTRILRRDLIGYTVRGTLMSTLIMFGYWGLFSWVPGFVSTPVSRGGAGLTMVKAPLWTIPMMVGAFFGYISFGFIADRYGRRPTFVAYLFISAVLVWLFGSCRSATVLLLGPAIGFFGSGYFSIFGALLSELFPTQVRGTGVGFCYNAGRMLSAVAPTLVGALSLNYGVGGALAFLAIAFTAGGLCIFSLPETRGTALE